jgi:arginine:ornithine antiporter/lysine permease
MKAKREQGIHPFQGKEKLRACALTIVAVFAFGMIWQGGF